VLEDFALKNPSINFVGILTRDNNSAAQDFVTRFKLSYPIATDDSILTKFRGSLIPDAIPTTIVIDAQGRVAARISGEVTVDILQKVLASVTGGAVNA
jgi:peroxiredoxin